MPAARWWAASTYPFPGTTDFSSYLLQAQSSGAKVLGIANAGADTINTIKQAKEFGIKMQLAGLLLFLTDVHSLGLESAQGIVLTDSFYWDMNPRRARVLRSVHRAMVKDVRPTMVHAGVYSSVAALPEGGDRDGRRRRRSSTARRRSRR